jgi:hypothetical protein
VNTDLHYHVTLAAYPGVIATVVGRRIDEAGVEMLLLEFNASALEWWPATSVVAAA